MTRRRKGRRPGEQRDTDEHGQPRVGPDGRPDGRGYQSNVYTPPPSPLTRWQHHARGSQGAPRHRARATDTGRVQFGPGARPGAQQPSVPNADRARWTPPTGTAAVPRYDRRGGPPPQARQQQPQQRRFGGDRHRARPDAARPAPASAPRPANTTIEPFDLFCAYHLGITPEGGYRIQNIHEVARRFGTNAGALRQVLTDLGMSADDIVHSGFDLPSAQVDIMVAPEGISRRELARPLYEEFRNAPKKTRDWAREMEDAQRQIDETIGRDGRWSPAPRDPAGKQS